MAELLNAATEKNQTSEQMGPSQIHGRQPQMCAQEGPAGYLFLCSIFPLSLVILQLLPHLSSPIHGSLLERLLSVLPYLHYNGAHRKYATEDAPVGVAFYLLTTKPKSQFLVLLPVRDI